MKYKKKKNKRHVSSVLQQREELLFNRYRVRQANGSPGLRKNEKLEEDSADGAGGKDYGKGKGGRSPGKESRMSSG
jgi:hypothetical protein